MRKLPTGISADKDATPPPSKNSAPPPNHTRSGPSDHGGIGRPNAGGFHKMSTMDNLFNTFYGFQSGNLLVEVGDSRNMTKNTAYCELECERQKFQTQPLSKEQTSWNEEFSFDVGNNRSELTIHVSYFKRIGGKGNLGSLTFPLKDLSGGTLVEGWYPLKLKGKDKLLGEIFLKMQYTSAVDRNKDYNLAKQHYPKLMRIVLSQDIIILATLCRVYESEELSKTIIRLFNAEGQALRLLIQLIYRDLKHTKAEVTLFRNDSMATKTTRNYFRMISPDYLKDLLYPLISEISANPSGFEVDPAKLGAETATKLQPNMERLKAMVSKYLDRIINSVDSTPVNMRKFFNLLRQLIRQCFPNSELKAIGAFLFLRFICPAIVAPNAFGIWEDQISPEVRRTLTLITKVLQNLANNITFFKEPYMEPLTPFLTDNRERIVKFYENISSIPNSGPPDAARARFTEEDKVKAVSLILGQFNKNYDTFIKALPEDPRMKDPDANRITSELLHQLKEILNKQ